MSTRSKINELFRRDEILRAAAVNGRFEPQSGQGALAKRMWKQGLLLPIFAGVNEAYRITDAGRELLASNES